MIVLISVSSVLGQVRSKNNPYSPSPTGKNQESVSAAVPENKLPGPVAFVSHEGNASPRENVPFAPPTITREPKTAGSQLLAFTDIYKIGIGDVLFINLKNSAQGAGYYTVRSDGSIDYPLAGASVRVVDQTTDALSHAIARAVKLYANPQVEVKVHEYLSHSVTVLGLAANAGQKSLQREAMPLFALRAEAEVRREANKVVITRASGGKSRSLYLSDQNTDNTLIYPGDTVEFVFEKEGSPSSASHYFLAGEVVSGGRRDLTAGLTLYRAIVGAGGVRGDAMRATIRRKSEKGIMTITEHNLYSLKDGKIVDPVLVAGDVIEIRK